MAGSDYGVSVRTLDVIAYAVTAVWAANIFAPLAISSFESNSGVNGIMGALLGVIGAARWQASRSRNRQEQEPAGDEDGE